MIGGHVVFREVENWYCPNDSELLMLTCSPLNITPNIEDDLLGNKASRNVNS